VKHVAIVGASSQIGQALLPLLADAGYASYCIGREDRRAVKNITTYVFDESHLLFDPPLESVDTVISLAPLPSIQVVVKMAQLLGAKRIIAFGSTGKFSKIDSTSAIERDFVLQQDLAEKTFVDQCETLGIGWTLFRPTMIYGADADLNVSFIKSIIRRFRFFPIPIGANGLRQPVHVDDLAIACVLALGCEVTLNKAYNLGGGEVLSYKTLVSKIFQSEGMRPLLIPIPKSLFLLLIAIAQKFSKASFVRKEMVDRMFKDLTLDHHAAKDDFGYAPSPFCLNRKASNQNPFL